MTVMYFIFIYFFFVFVLVRVFVPHLGFTRKPIPENIPVELLKVINSYNQLAKSNFEFLELAYGYVTENFTGSRIQTVTHWQKAFEDVYTQRPGFLPCTGQNYLLRTMLIKSGRFTESDTAIKVVPLNFFIHQYLLVTVEESVVKVDPWSHFLGKNLGEVTEFFG